MLATWIVDGGPFIVVMLPKPGNLRDIQRQNKRVNIHVGNPPDEDNDRFDLFFE